jgi:hypothetical protein
MVMNRWHRSAWLSALFFALVVALGASAARADGSAPDSEARARSLYRTASAHFDAGRYVEAQAEFSAGYELSHKPGFLWNMAECARLLAHPERALGLYRQYVAVAAPSTTRVDAQNRIRELEASHGASHVESLVAPMPSTASPSTSETALALASRTSTTSTTMSAPSTERATVLAPSTAMPAKEGQKPITTKWWFWAAAAGVAAAAIVTTAIVVNSDGSTASPAIPSGANVVSWR